MLVLLTAAISAARRRPTWSSASRMHSQISRQLRVGVEDLRAGEARQRGVAPLALADRDLPAVLVEQDRPAAAGAEVDGEQEAHQAADPVRRAARPGPVGEVDEWLARDAAARSRRRPSRRRGGGSRTSRRRCAVAITTFGKASSGWRPVAGEGLTTSNAAPASRPEARPSATAPSSIERVPGGVDEVAAWLHPARSRPARSCPRLSAVARAWSDTKSALSSSVAEVDRLGAGGRRSRPGRRTGRTRSPASRRRAPGGRPARPIWPKPIRPRVCPARSWPNQCAPS